jgi:hypothetical protein
MSKDKNCGETKDFRSIYLSEDHWDYLNKISYGSPTKAIRKMIEERCEQEEKQDAN